jgi:hypothetical protein
VLALLEFRVRGSRSTGQAQAALPAIRIPPLSCPGFPRVLDQPLTIVLPVYNFEGKLRGAVQDVLELAHSFAHEFSLVIVDDGSTDDTYETACELARKYPQMRVLRQAVRQGLGRVLDTLRNNLAAETLVVHDGVSPIDVSQLKALLHTRLAGRLKPDAETSTCGSRRLSSLRALHDDMEQAHRRLTGFRWMRLERPLTPRRYRDPASPVVISSLGSLPAGSVPVPFA